MAKMRLGLYKIVFPFEILYIYIYRKREREGENTCWLTRMIDSGGSHMGAHRHCDICIYMYFFIYLFISIYV